MEPNPQVYKAITGHAGLSGGGYDVPITKPRRLHPVIRGALKVLFVGCMAVWALLMYKAGEWTFHRGDRSNDLGSLMVPGSATDMLGSTTDLAPLVTQVATVGLYRRFNWRSGFHHLFAAWGVFGWAMATKACFQWVALIPEMPAVPVALCLGTVVFASIATFLAGGVNLYYSDTWVTRLGSEDWVHFGRDHIARVPGKRELGEQVNSSRLAQLLRSVGATILYDSADYVGPHDVERRQLAAGDADQSFTDGVVYIMDGGVFSTAYLTAEAESVFEDIVPANHNSSDHALKKRESVGRLTSVTLSVLGFSPGRSRRYMDRAAMVGFAHDFIYATGEHLQPNWYMDGDDVIINHGGIEECTMITWENDQPGTNTIVRGKWRLNGRPANVEQCECNTCH